MSAGAFLNSPNPQNRLESIALYKQALLVGIANGCEDRIERALALKDLFFLLVYVLRRRDIDDDWLFARCREVESAPDGYLDLWPREHYKMHRLDEPVPTPTGWKKHGDLREGDALFGIDGSVCHVTAVTPVFTDGPAFEIEFDDGVKISAGADHLWPVERRTWKRIPLAYNRPGEPRRKYRETVILSTKEISEHGADPDARLAMPVSWPLRLPEVSLPIDPYVLGAWLGDGTSSNGDITCGDPELFDEIERRGYLFGHDKSPNRNARVSKVENLAMQLRDLNLYNNKHIPSVYLRASFTQRLDLLRGLMDTDGHCNSRGTATFCNTNENIVDGICELLHTLAMKPHRREYSFMKDGMPYRYWQVSFQAYAATSPFTLFRKSSRCKIGGRKNARRFVVGCRPINPEPMSCIQVDREDGLYIVGKSFLPTHNSTIITFAKTIQDILNNPELTVGILSFNRPTAKKFLTQIKHEFEANEKLRSLFPDVVWDNPHRESPKWSDDDGIVLKRTGNPKESTIEAHGLVDGQPTGRHWNLVIYDDVVTRESVTTPDMIRKVTEAWELSLALGTQNGKVRYIGTRYHYNDTYRTILERGAAKERRHTATVDGRVEGEPVLWTREQLAQRRRDQGEATFASQYMLDPSSDRTHGFREEWLRYYQGDATANTNRYILVDPASSKKKESDYTAIAVLGLGSDENYYLLDAVRDRLSLTERGDALFQMHRRWKPKAVGYEAYGQQADIEYLKDRMGRENYRFEITKVGGQLSKEDRIRRLIPVFEGGRFYLPEALTKVDYEGRHVDLARAFVDEEYKPFPVGLHEDLFDAIARIWDVQVLWPKAGAGDERYAKGRERRRVGNVTYMAA